MDEEFVKDLLKDYNMISKANKDSEDGMLNNYAKIIKDYLLKTGGNPFAGNNESFLEKILDFFKLAESKKIYNEKNELDEKMKENYQKFKENVINVVKDGICKPEFLNNTEHCFVLKNGDVSQEVFIKWYYDTFKLFTVMYNQFKNEKGITKDYNIRTGLNEEFEYNKVRLTHQSLHDGMSDKEKFYFYFSENEDLKIPK